MPGMESVSSRGRKLSLSVPRRIVCDVMAIAKAIPTVPVQRDMNIANVVAARACAARAGVALAPPGWCAIFTKAYAITTMRFPELRRAFMSYPFSYLYEHPFSTASIAIERQYDGENAIFWGHLRQPDKQPLCEIQSQLRHLKDEPIDRIDQFKRYLRVGRLPGPIRRLSYWLALNWSGRKRAGYFGTFLVSAYSGLGAASLHPISPLTTTLNYGPIAKDGAVSVRIIYDHRVMDGSTVARALACLEEVLNTEIVAELQQQAQVRVAV